MAQAIIGGHVPGHAAGGVLDKGWNLVGGRGAELVNGTTGRVLTAGQTKSIDNGTGGIHVDKFELTIVNPVPEPVSVSVPAGLHRSALVLGMS